ncbi:MULTISPECIES: hypothetical protein [unclassified Actinotalea]|uniref:hypothetical protein n=1 Tax=unclassified Actinotalea TaxID=2638618 RepID=UPI0015F6AA8B|nr:MULTISPECIES: hypothetical protein [unclassified Actinotalea]
MEIARDLLLVLHFVGLASLLGGFLVQMKPKTKKIDAAMFHGALTQLVTGVALVGMAYALGNGEHVDNLKIGIKTLVLLVIFALVLRGRRQQSVSTGVWGAIGGLTLLNIIVAVVW